MDSVGIIGLGYVGLPLAVEFGKVMKTVGFDIDKKRIAELIKGHDRTREVSGNDLGLADKLSYSSNPDELKDINYFIVTVPTPVDDYKQPDLRDFGKLHLVTQGTGPSNGDGGQGMMP